MSSTKILGTSMTCSGTATSKSVETSTSSSPISSTGKSRDGKNGALSPNSSTVCRRTHSCGLTPARRSGRDPAAGTSSTSRKSTQCLPPGGWDAPERGRLVLLVPTRPLPSSVSVELSGAKTRRGPGRSTAAHAARQHAVVVLSDHRER